MHSAVPAPHSLASCARSIYGAAVQVSGPPPTPNPGCLHPSNNTFEPCTGYCEVLGTGTPIWSLTNPFNGRDGGITMTYYGVPPTENNPNKCDPVNGEGV